MFQTTHEKLYLTIDRLEDDSVLTTNQKGFRLSLKFWKAYLYSPSQLKNRIIHRYNDCNYIHYVTVNRERGKKEKECPKQNPLSKKLSPKFSGNLAFDIIMIIFFYLSGTEKTFLSIEELKNHLSKGWVFLD